MPTFSQVRKNNDCQVFGCTYKYYRDGNELRIKNHSNSYHCKNSDHFFAYLTYILQPWALYII